MYVIDAGAYLCNSYVSRWEHNVKHFPSILLLRQVDLIYPVSSINLLWLV